MEVKTPLNQLKDCKLYAEYLRWDYQRRLAIQNQARVREQLIPHLSQLEKPRVDFSLDGLSENDKITLGHCTGLTLQKKTRRNPLSAKALKEELQKIITMHIYDLPGMEGLDVETLKLFLEKIMTDLYKATPAKPSISIAVVGPENANDGRKRKFHVDPDEVFSLSQQRQRNK